MRGPRAVLVAAVVVTVAGVAPAVTGSALAAGAPSPTPVCSTADTHVTVELEQPASGQDAVAVHVTAGSTCVTTGYPSATVLDAAGDEVRARHQPTGYFGGLAVPSTTPPRITLRKGQEATALVEFGTHAPPSGTHCPARAGLRLGLPHTAGTTTRGLTFTACARTVTVNPLVPGATGVQ